MHRTPCYDWHVAHRGRMVDFAGWEMPVQYSTITAEHLAVRQAAGVFDIAHMGRLRMTGPDAARFLDFLVTKDVHSLQVGQIRYALACNEAGGILDDVLVYRFAEFYLLVVNASNRQKILEWVKTRQSGFDSEVRDMTMEWSMLALQGPRALEIAQRVSGEDYSALKYYTGLETELLGSWGVVSRTGYTGEDGVEFIVPQEHGLRLWEEVVQHGAEFGLQPCGLGARDTLRLEAAMPLYGHELSETIDPLTAGLGFAVDLNAADFLGKDAIAAIRQDTGRRKRIGLELDGRRIAREGAGLFAGASQVGEVTSGTFSPTLEKSIAMAYVAPDQSAAGTELQVDIRGKRVPATVVKLPFYRRRSDAD